MVSVDCAEYASHLVAKDWSKTREFLWKWGISRLIGMLERGEVDFIVQCSNTSHMALEEDKLAELQANYHSMLLKHQSKFLHIADATANAIRKQNDKKPLIVGLLGTEPTMREDYLKDRLLLHSDCVQRVVSPAKDGPLSTLMLFWSLSPLVVLFLISSTVCSHCQALNTRIP